MHRAAVILISLLFLSSFNTQANAQADFWACPRLYEGQTLNVYNWTTYIAEDTIANFERLCGVMVVYNTYSSDSDMLEELRQGNPGYDVVVPSNSTVYLLIAENLIQPLNFNNIPNFGAVGEQFKNPPHDPVNRYTVPYQWGTIGVGYNRTALGGELTSWNDVFNATARVAWLDEARPMLGFALLMLGYDPNTGEPSQIEEAVQYLAEHSTNVAAIAPDTGQDLLEAGTADIVIEYNGDIFQLIASCECDDFAYMLPSEGAQIWTDSLAVPVGAPNKALAEVFIDYMLNAQVGADISNYTAYASPNALAISEGLISNQYLTNPAIYPDESVMPRLFYTVTDPTLDDLYETAWNTLHNQVGR